MKNLSKILCAILVLAMLCSSFVFIAGAEEAADSTVTSVAASEAEVYAAIKYEAEDNLFSKYARYSNTTSGWNGENAPQAHVVTDPATGRTYYHQFVNGTYGLKEGASDGNDYINLNFTKVSLQKTEGYTEYIVLDYDIAYKHIPGTYMGLDSKTGEPKQYNGWKLASQIVHRNSGGSGLWGTSHTLADYASEDFVHVTVVYDYSTSNVYMFLDGTLFKTFEKGAMSAAGYESYLAGDVIASSEFKFGSNSYDDLKLDNVYIRYEKLTDEENTLDDAIKTGNIVKWDGNVLVTSLKVTPLEQSQWTDASFYKLNSDSNQLSKGDLSQLNNDFLANAVTTPNGDSYIRIDTLKTGDVEGHFQWSLFSDVPIQYNADAPQYAIYDMDIGTETALSALAFVTNTRTGANGQGWDVGSGGGNMFVSEKINITEGFQHLTIVLDYNGNRIYYFLNNTLVHDAKIFNDTIDAQFKNGHIEDSVNWKGEAVEGSDYVYPAIKIQAHASYGKTPLNAGETFLLANLNVQVLAGTEAGNIAAALGAKDITAWDGNAYDADYVFPELPAIATIDGQEFYSTGAIEAHLAKDIKATYSVEFKRNPVTPVNFKANATINTNGLDIEDLVNFDEACSKPIVDGNLYTVSLGWSINYAVKDVTSGNSLDLGPIKYNHSNNILGAVSLANYHTADHRHINFVTNLDTGDVFVNDFPVGTINTASNTYIQIAPNGKIMYEKGVGQTIVYDFDMAVYDRINTAPLNFVSRYGSGSGAWGNSSRTTGALFENVELGQFAHVTIVLAVDSRMGYYFINNELIFADANIITEQAEWLEALRCFGNSTADLLYDNICIRQLKNGEIEEIAKAGDLSKWSGAIYGADYTLPVAPTVATVDGVPYGSVDAVNKVLAQDGETAKNVQIMHIPAKGEERTFKIRTSATVDTQGLDVSLDWNTGIYEFDPNNDFYVSTETGLAYASSKLIHTSLGDIHTFTAIDASNCFNTATAVTWFYDDTLENYDVVFYVFGDTIAPRAYNAFIEDGVFYHDEWKEIFVGDDGEVTFGEILDEFPAASSNIGEKLYMYELVTKEVDFIASDIKVGAVVNSAIEFTVYVNKYETLTTGDIVVLNGVEYVALKYEVAPHELDKMVEAKFIVTDAEGNEYVQLQRVSFIDYAEEVLSGEYAEADKKVVANLLAYANEASVLFNGEKIAEVTALLETYASHVTSAELTEKVDTSALASVIRSAALRLNGTPEFVFKVARGFNGTITFTYEGVTGPVEVKVNVDASRSEQLVSLPVDVCDLQADITITAGDVSGIYNLATYAQSLENNAFATALYNYSAVAKAHKQGLVFVYVITGYDKDNNPITEVYGEYAPGSKINIPFLHDGLTITWYLGDGEDRTEIDINNFVITENITLSYTEVINQSALEIVTAENLKLINETMLKNFDSCKFVTAVKDGQPVEAILLSRTTEWPENSDINAFWTEQAYTLDGSRKLATFSFDYLVLGTVGNHQAPSGESYSQGILQIKYTDSSAADLGLIEPLKIVDYGNNVLIEDGQWHTFTYTAANPVELDSIIIKIYKLVGDMLVTNIQVEYAPLNMYEDDGSLNVNTILKDKLSASSYNLTTIVEGKIKQLDQATLDDGTGANANGWFTKEGGTARYVLAVKDGEQVEAIYFSRSKDWTTYASASQNAGFSEIRFAIDSTKVVESISFEYVINGTVRAGDYGEGVFQIRKADSSYLDIQSGEDTYVEDGQWHTYTWENTDEYALQNFLFKLSYFEGEFVISNIVITYAE